jgi:hypothetical protein
MAVNRLDRVNALLLREIADDLYFGSAGIGSPSVLVRNLDIAGN